MRSKVIEFESSQGTRRAVLDRPGAVEPTASVLMVHCLEEEPAARFSAGLVEAGYAVIRIDAGAVPDSDPGLAPADVTAAYHAAAAVRVPPPALLVGHSVGGTAALLAAEKLSTLQAVAVLAPMTGPGALERLRTGDEGQGTAAGPAAGRWVRVQSAMLESAAGVGMADALEWLGTPLLVLYHPDSADADGTDVERIHETTRHVVSTVTVPGGGHRLQGEGDAGWIAGLVAQWAGRWTGVGPAPARAVGPVEAWTGADYRTEIVAAGQRMMADEPLNLDGHGAGPAPYEWLAAGLAACTGITLRMYAERKGLDLEGVGITVGYHRHEVPGQKDAVLCFRREIRIEGGIDAKTRARMVEIAKRCPVHKTLTKGAEIETHGREPEEGGGRSGDA